MSDQNSLQRLSQALQKINKESSRKHTALRKALQEAQDHIADIGKRNVEVNKDGVPTDAAELDRLANKLVIPLRLACETRQSKLMSTALDSLHKMIDYVYFRGTAVDEENPGKKLVPKVITIIGNCFDFPDDLVQLQIIKAFLSAVASPSCDIHETSLLNAIRTCYNIYLVSKNPVNQGTAKGTLTQMLHIIFGRMELKMSPDVVIGSIDLAMDRLVDEQLADAEDLKQNQMISEMNAEIQSTEQKTNGGASPRQEVKLEEELPDLQSPESVAKEVVWNIVDKIQGVEAPHVNGVAEQTMSASDKKKQEEGHFVFNDCYLIFRALCKLSMKNIPKDSTPDSIDMRSKILSLELLLSILESSGPVFRSCDKFINTAIKKYLIISLLLNGTSSNPTVFRLSLKIFLSLVSYFKDYLKNEIGVFYSKVFLVILESANSTLQQKWMVLQVLLQICKNPQALVDIFVNYDCDLDSKDIYERMTNDLSKIAQGRHVLDKVNWTPQELKLKTLGLECLVTIMKSLVDWSKELRIEKPVDDEVKEEKKETEEKEDATPKEEGPSKEEEDEVRDLLSQQNNREEELSKPGRHDPDFMKLKEFKLKQARGMAKFKMSAKHGMKYLIESGVVEGTPEAVAKFLRNTEGLDKTKIGEFIGHKDEFNTKVRNAYIDSFSFAGMEIDLALRYFLSQFRIPGEAQQIDRLMEKYAERYFNENPQSPFANADAVYLLSFSIIMLATDLHSPSIKVKIKKEEWIRNQHNNNDGKDYDPQFLSQLFDRIQAQRITLQDDDSFDADGELSTDPKQRRDRFTKEMERTIQKSKVEIKEKAKDSGTYYRAKQIEHVRPMFEIAWCPMLAAFSVLLEDSDDQEVITLCLDGFKYAIHVSCTFLMEVERNAFVTALAKFTMLNNPREMKPKNIESIKLLIEIARTEANYLQDSWLQVLMCISHLEQVHLVGLGAKPISIQPVEDRKTTPLRPSISLSRKLSMSPLPYDKTTAEAVSSTLDSFAIDRVFTSSTRLNNNAIEHFVKALCQVSQDEIESPNPQMFSLQKLVELAHFNMDRIRLVWTRIWCVLADHFTKVGCDSNPRIAMYAIDSLKQLAMKFLEKPELSNYSFQKEFLKPFELIIANNPSIQIRQLVCDCLSNMVRSKGANIRSGWKGIFVASTVAASDHDETIVRVAYNTIDIVIQNHFPLIAESFFVDCINCLIAFGNGHLFIDISLKAVQSMIHCTDQLAAGRVMEISKDENGVVFTADNKVHLSYWFPILTGLSGIVSHSHIDVRTAALRGLFTILANYGNTLNNRFWELIFRGVLLPIFDNVQYASRADLLKEDNEWLTTTCLLALNSLVDLFSNFFPKVSFLLPELLNLLVGCILQDNESLARIGATCLLQLGMTDGPKFSEDQWSIVCSRFGHILDQNTVRELVDPKEKRERRDSMGRVLSVDDGPQYPSRGSPVLNGSDGSSSELAEPLSDSPVLRSSGKSLKEDQEAKKAQKTASIKVVKGHCTVQLGLIEALNEIVFTHYSSLATSHLETLLDSLQACYEFSSGANNNSLLYGKLQKTGTLDLLLRQETMAISSYLRILFRMYAETVKDVDKRTQIGETRLIQRCKEILALYLQKSSDSNSQDAQLKRLVSAYTQIVVQILKGVGDLHDDQFAKHLPVFYPLFNELILTESKDIRGMLKDIFTKVGKLQTIARV